MANFGRLRITWPGLSILALLVILYLILSKNWNRLTRMTTINETGKDVYLRLIEAGFNPFMAQIITAQAAHETANFTSQVYLQNNNLFGYKYVGQKIAKGEKNGHAFYENIEDSISDFKRYYQLRQYPKIFASVAEYVKTLKKNFYFEAPESEYLKGVEHFYKLYFNG